MAVLKSLHICLLRTVPFNHRSSTIIIKELVKIAKKIVQNDKYDQEVIRRRRGLR